MNPVKISRVTRDIGRPANWTPSMGECGSLPVRDEVAANGANIMMSAWRPSDYEISLMKAGSPVILTIYGTTHPVVSLGIGSPSDLVSERPDHPPHTDQPVRPPRDREVG